MENGRQKTNCRSSLLVGGNGIAPKLLLAVLPTQAIFKQTVNEKLLFESMATAKNIDLTNVEHHNCTIDLAMTKTHLNPRPTQI